MPASKPPVSIVLRTILFSCEHGGNEIPHVYLPYFEGQEKLLASHRGWDIGALEVANDLSSSLSSTLHFATTSRLLIELNRSLHHPNLFSAISKLLPKQEKEKIIEGYYQPYRNAFVEQVEKELSESKQVIHISVHSFTPVLDEEVRNADIGLLYDPSIPEEKKFCKEWKQELQKFSSFRIRYNYPYKGTADGFTTYLRKKFPENYIGIELELNQALLTNESTKKQLTNDLIKSLDCFKD